MREWFAQDPKRFSMFSREQEHFLFDFSRNRICGETLDKLLALSEECEVEAWRDRMFAGECINLTENLPVQHVALRDLEDATSGLAESQNRVLECMETLALQVREQGLTDVVHLGAGGSHLGQKLVCDAFCDEALPGLNMHFVANVDTTEIQRVLHGRVPHRTLFIVASKSFSTPETLSNAGIARNWLMQDDKANECIERHFVGITANVERALAWGLQEHRVLPMWNSVGGRFSVWSAAGLSIVLYLGMPAFRELLRGAREMDRHFRTAAAGENLPVLLALLGIWNQHFLDTAAHVVLPYDMRLRYLPAYLQQLELESNGKCVDRAGRALDVPDAAIVFGEVGTNAQHGFFQFLHQGGRAASCDFIGVVRPGRGRRSQHEMLLSNMIAQTRALMFGQTLEEVRAQGNAACAEHKVFPGNRTSNTILLRQLTPYSLGQLMALYEHKVFVQGVLLNINSFDQPGVELGKRLAKHLLDDLQTADLDTDLDSATRALLAYYKKHA